MNKIKYENVTFRLKIKLDDIAPRMETRQRKSLHTLALQSGLSKSSVETTKKLPNLRPCAITAVQLVVHPGCKARSRYAGSFVIGILWIFNPEHVFFFFR